MIKSRGTKGKAGVTFTVNTTLDVLGNSNGMLSLRQAIIDANATPKKAATIVLPAGNYTLTATTAMRRRKRPAFVHRRINARRPRRKPASNRSVFCCPR